MRTHREMVSTIESIMYVTGLTQKFKMPYKREKVWAEFNVKYFPSLNSNSKERGEYACFSFSKFSLMSHHFCDSCRGFLGFLPTCQPCHLGFPLKSTHAPSHPMWMGGAKPTPSSPMGGHLPHALYSSSPGDYFMGEFTSGTSGSHQGREEAWGEKCPGLPKSHFITSRGGPAENWSWKRGKLRREMKGLRERERLWIPSNTCIQPFLKSMFPCS